MNNNAKTMIVYLGGKLSENHLYQAFDRNNFPSVQWIERASLRNPEIVIVVLGSENLLDDDKNIIAYLKEQKIPIMIQGNVNYLASERFAVDPDLNVVKMRSFSNDLKNPEIDKYISKYSNSGMELEIVVDANKDVISSVSDFLGNHSATNKTKASLSSVVLSGYGELSPDDINCLKENVLDIYSVSATSRISVIYSEIPICSIPYSLFENIEFNSIIVKRKLLKGVNRKCRLCVLKDICCYSGRVSVSEEVLHTLEPFDLFEIIPSRFRRAYSSISKTLLVDSVRKLSVFGPCNNRCVDCPDQVYSKTAVSPRDGLRLVTKAWSDGADKIVIGDGEPTIRKDFLSLIKAIEWYGMGAVVHTNGRLLMIDAFLSKLSEHPDCELVVRLAGYDENTHDEAVQTKSFEQVCSGLKKAVDKGLNISVSVRLRPNIIDNLDKLILICYEIGVDLNIDVPPHWIYFPDACTYSALMEKVAAGIGRCDLQDSRSSIYIQGIPICMMGRLQRMYRPGKGGEFAKPPVCNNCSFTEWCCGLPESYSLSFGTSELRPEIKNSESQLCFPEIAKNEEFDIDECPIKSGEQESPPPGSSMIVKMDNGYYLYQMANEGTDLLNVIATKNARANAWLSENENRAKLSLSQHCVECRKLHECAACFETDSKNKLLEDWNFEYEPRTLLVNRELNNHIPRGLQYDEHITFRDFWQRMSRGGAGMPAYRTIVIHDSIDFFPSAARAVGEIAHLAPRGCNVFITGRNFQVEGGRTRGGDCVPAIHPHSISEAAETTPLVLKDYTLNSGGVPSYWILNFQKEASPSAKSHREKLASFFIIRTCVANCIMCNVQNYFTNTRMPLMKVLNGLDELRINRFEYVDLFGGEVTLRQDLEFILKYASSIGLKPMIITTGHSLDKDKVEKIRDSGAVRITVSLDGADEITHEKIKNANGLFNKALQAVKNVASVPGVELNVNTVLLPENIKSAANIVELSGTHGSNVSRFFLCVCSPAASTMDRKLSDEQLHELIGNFAPDALRVAANYGMEIDVRPELPEKGFEEEWIKRVSNGVYNPVYSSENIVCAAPGVRTLIDLDGNVYPCEAPLLFDSEHCIGNMDANSLAKILNSEKMKLFMNKAGKTKECAMCFGAMPCEIKKGG